MIPVSAFMMLLAIQPARPPTMIAASQPKPCISKLRLSGHFRRMNAKTRRAVHAGLANFQFRIGRVRDQSRKSSLIEVLERVCASTRLTITAQ